MTILKILFLKVILRSFAVVPINLPMCHTTAFTHPCTIPALAKSVSRQLKTASARNPVTTVTDEKYLAQMFQI
jgi:hypothetical protein